MQSYSITFYSGVLLGPVCHSPLACRPTYLGTRDSPYSRAIQNCPSTLFQDDWSGPSRETTEKATTMNRHLRAYNDTILVTILKISRNPSIGHFPNIVNLNDYRRFRTAGRQILAWGIKGDICTRSVGNTFVNTLSNQIVD